MLPIAKSVSLHCLWITSLVEWSPDHFCQTCITSLHHLFIIPGSLCVCELYSALNAAVTPWSLSCSSSGDFCPRYRLQERTGQTWKHTQNKDIYHVLHLAAWLIFAIHIRVKSKSGTKISDRAWFSYVLCWVSYVLWWIRYVILSNTQWVKITSFYQANLSQSMMTCWTYQILTSWSLYSLSRVGSEAETLWELPMQGKEDLVRAPSTPSRFFFFILPLLEDFGNCSWR